MINSIIFDWGGVLAPSDNKIGIIRLKKNFEFDEKVFFKYYDNHEDDYCNTNNYTEFLNDVSKKFNIPVNSIIKAFNADPPDEVFSIAKKLSNNYKTYILSNQIKFRTDYIKKTFDLNFFNNTFFSNEMGVKKPSNKIYTILLNEINQKPEHCLFIDDSPINIEAAKKLGFNVILFKSIEQLKKELTSFSIQIK